MAPTVGGTIQRAAVLFHGTTTAAAAEGAATASTSSMKWSAGISNGTAMNNLTAAFFPSSSSSSAILHIFERNGTSSGVDNSAAVATTSSSADAFTVVVDDQLQQQQQQQFMDDEFAAVVDGGGGDTPNCTYRYDLNDDLIRLISLWLDGPITIIAALLAFVGCHFAVRFLARAGLNRELSAALYTLCICDAFLTFMVVIYHSLEACSILFFGTNLMWNEQSSVLITHGILSSATTASTLLVVFITFQRFLVVWWPLRYARIRETKRTDPNQQRKSSSSIDQDTTEFSGIFRSGGLVRTLSKRLLNNHHKTVDLRKLFRPFLFPMCVVIFAFCLNFSVFFEFELVPCFAFAHNTFSMQLYPSPLRQSQIYYMIRTTIFMASQSIGPILCITLLTIVTEWKVHVSLKARRILFEAQSRRRSLIALEELKEKVSRTVSIFIAIKFLILRSLPIFFDIYETFYGIESFGIVLSILVRLSDFGVVLNAATNSLAYFGKTEFFANRLKSKLMKEKQHIMVAKAASACLVTGIAPKCLPKPTVKTCQAIRSMPFADLARRREQRKTVTYGVMMSGASSARNSSNSTVDTPLLRNSSRPHFLSLRNGLQQSDDISSAGNSNNNFQVARRVQTDSPLVRDVTIQSGGEERLPLMMQMMIQNGQTKTTTADAALADVPHLVGPAANGGFRSMRAATMALLLRADTNNSSMDETASEPLSEPTACCCTNNNNGNADAAHLPSSGNADLEQQGECADAMQNNINQSGCCEHR